MKRGLFVLVLPTVIALFMLLALQQPLVAEEDNEILDSSYAQSTEKEIMLLVGERIDSEQSEVEAKEYAVQSPQTDRINHYEEIVWERQQTYQVYQQMTVWVIVTTTYSWLPASEWEAWQTSSGELKMTYRQHSVVIVGYDEDSIYIRDPFGRRSEAPRNSFQSGWEQIGSQAITYVDKS
jgi:hypothetical protein